MDDRALEARCAELTEQVRLLSLENDLLAERAEETLLLGLLAEKVGEIETVAELLAVGLEQIAVLRDLPFVACLLLNGQEVRLEQIYSVVPGLAPGRSPVQLEADLVESLREGRARVLSGAEACLSLLKGAAGGFLPVACALLPLPSLADLSRFLVLATDRDEQRLHGMLPALCRLTEMIAARIDNIELLNRLTALNADLDRQVFERTRELTASEVRNRTLFERAFDAFFVVDNDLMIRDVNRQACCSLGYSRDELMGQNISELPIGLDRGEFARVAARSARGEIQTVTAVLRNRNGLTFPVEARIGPIDIGDQTMTLAEVRDVSERNRLQEQLLQSQKMEAVGRMAGGVAHDFNNILTIIMGQVGLLREDLGDGHRAQAELDLIQAAGDRATGLTRQLLSFSRKQAIDMKPLELSTTVAESSQLLARVLGEEIKLQLDLDPAARFIYGDSVRIDQILMNLVINARDALPQGGTIRISTGVMAPEPDFLPAAVGGPPPTGHHVAIRVADNGTGIPPEVLSRVFEPFFTTKEAGKGTGLGLAMVYGLARQQQALVRVDSEPGRGTTFEVIFPEIVLTGPGREAQTSTGIPTGTETVLLVEDDETITQVMSRMLKRLGYRTLQAADGVEALQVAAAHDGRVDLVLTDVMMPRLGGVELVRQLKQQDPGLRVIYMSGYSGEHLDPAEIRAPGTRYLQKPISHKQLALCLRECLSERSAP